MTGWLRREKESFSNFIQAFGNTCYPNQGAVSKTPFRYIVDNFNKIWIPILYYSSQVVYTGTAQATIAISKSQLKSD